MFSLSLSVFVFQMFEWRALIGLISYENKRQLDKIMNEFESDSDRNEKRVTKEYKK